MTKQFWKTFVVVFVVAYAANILAAWLIGRFVHNAQWSWDVTTTTAVIIAVVVARIYREGADTTAAAARTKTLALFTGGRDVTNDMVQHALGISDATATRYLDALEKSGDIVQIGDTGSGVVYRKK